MNVLATFGQLANKTLPRAVVSLGSLNKQSVVETPKMGAVKIQSKTTYAIGALLNTKYFLVA